MNAYEGLRRSYESYESSGASPFSVFSGASPFSVLIATAILGKVGRRRSGHWAECVRGLSCAGANFSRMRPALGLPADRPTQSPRKAVRWGFWQCACSQRARGGAGVVACQVLRVLVWSVCAGSVQPGRVR